MRDVSEFETDIVVRVPVKETERTLRVAAINAELLDEMKLAADWLEISLPPQLTTGLIQYEGHKVRIKALRDAIAKAERDTPCTTA